MKYVIIVGDGMADWPIEELGGETPLMVASTPHMDWMAKHGEIGRVRTIPDGFAPGSEIANLSIMGYDPAFCFTGRGPIEAASLGISLGSDDIAFRCNLVTLSLQGSSIVLEDFTAGHIPDGEAREIVLDLNHEIGSHEIQFYPGVSYRHVMVWKNGVAKFPGLERIDLTPPHDIIGRDIRPYLPDERGNLGTGPNGQLITLMTRSQLFLRNHPVNVDREKRGLLPANSIWLWGQGRSPKMATLKARFGIEGYVISAVHLIKGIGILAGLDVLEVPGATGYFDTNYEGKAQFALKGLSERDLVYVHVEAPDEAGHMGDLQKKVEMIETFDRRIVGPILKGMEAFGSYKVLVLPDHATPLSIRTHAGDPVPYVLYSSEEERFRGDVRGFDERSAGQSGIYIEKGFELIKRLLRGS